MSRAGALKFSSWNRAGFFLIYSFLANFFFTPNIIHFIKKQYYLQQSKPKIEWKSGWNKEKKSVLQKWQFSDFQAEKKSLSRRKKVTSRVEPSWKYFSLSYGWSQLSSDSSLIDRDIFSSFLVVCSRPNLIPCFW